MKTVSERPSTAAQPPRPARSEPKPLILVVEDDQGVQEFYRDVLTSARYEVLIANTAVTAVNLARVEEPDLIMLDIKLSMNSTDEAWDGLVASEVLH